MNKYEMFDALKKYKDKQSNKTELNSMDSFMHAGTSYNHYQSNQPGYYAKLEDFWGKGKHRYFYTKAEWDAYNKNKQAAQNAGADRAAKEKENAAKKTPVEQAQSGREAAIKQAQENEKKRKEEEALKAARQAEEERKNRQTEVNKEAEQIKAEREAKRKAYLEKLQKNAKQTEERMAENRKEIEKVGKERKINKILNDGEDSLLSRWEDSFNFFDSMTYHGASEDQMRENNDNINEIYQQIAEIKALEETDPLTGLKIKNYELPIEDEIKLVNPGFYYSDEISVQQKYYNSGKEILTSYGFTEYDEDFVERYMADPTSFIDQSMNCYACTQAMALRKKGYDVTAGPDSDGILMDYDMFTGKQKDTPDPETGITYNDLWTGDFSDVKSYKDTKKKMEQEPEGSYGDFNISLILNDGSSMCHSIFYEIDNSGSIRYYDCQNGKEISNAEMEEWWNNAYVNPWTGEKMFETRYKRLDNQEFKGLKNMKDKDKVSSSVNVDVKGGNKK